MDPSIAGEIVRELRRIRRSLEVQEILMHADPSVQERVGVFHDDALRGLSRRNRDLIDRFLDEQD